MCSGQCVSATSRRFPSVFVLRLVFWSDTFTSLHAMRFVRCFGGRQHCVSPNCCRHPRYAIRRVPFVTRIPQGIMGNSTVHTIIATYWQSLVTCMQFAEVTFPGALRVIARGHMACMAAWKHVNREGKLLNLCGGVKKMTLKTWICF